MSVKLPLLKAVRPVVDGMSTDEESYFRCPECATLNRTVAVDYDGLGYPVCPSCGAKTGPLADSDTSISPARWRVRRVPRTGRGR
jgi:hypothetical protein